MYEKTSMMPCVVQIHLEPVDYKHLNALCGPLEQHLQQIEKYFSVEISRNDCHFQIAGDVKQVEYACAALQRLYQETCDLSQLKILDIEPEQIHLVMKEVQMPTSEPVLPIVKSTKNKHSSFNPRTPNQKLYLSCIKKNDIVFGVGPAGTGKTYLAVATAVQALQAQQVSQIVLTRPAVEAGEKLGFLPGDLSQKVDPYLRPLYDALFDFFGVEKTQRLLEKQIIEIAPLAYMRGRTLNDAFIILDEAQNTTIEQMKMFLTRVGFHAKAVITGDLTQIDLPRQCRSGLSHALSILKHVPGLGIHYFSSTDIIRHPIVEHIVNAYNDSDKCKDFD